MNNFNLSPTFLFQVGIYLPQPLTDHGKIYVAMSRVQSPDDVKLLIIDDPNGLQGRQKDTGRWFTKNHVIRQLWDFDTAILPPIPKDQRPDPPTAHIESSVTQTRANITNR
jgi:hypothetical protein